MEAMRMDMIQKDSEIDRLQSERKNIDQMFDEGILYKDNRGQIDYAKNDEQRKYLSELATNSKQVNPNI